MDGRRFERDGADRKIKLLCIRKLNGDPLDDDVGVYARLCHGNTGVAVAGPLIQV